MNRLRALLPSASLPLPIRRFARLVAASTLALTLAISLMGALMFAAAQEANGATNVELILDASGSMFNRLDDGRYRIVAAKEVLADLLAGLPEQDGLNVGLRVYGSSMRAIEDGACDDTVLKVPVAGFERQQLLDTVTGTQALGATPIALSLEQAAEDFPQEGRNVIVLITDGLESCRGDLREVAQMLRDRGIDLRIIGFDLDAAAVRGFDGLGAFENATSAAELLAALTRAVEVEAVTTTYPVTVTLTRAGAPATDGAAVAFVGAVDAEQFPLTAAPGAGEFTTALAAGSYVATVGDAFSAEPLRFAGLVVTAAGPNVFTFELAPVTSVTVSVVDSESPAGAIIDVGFVGAPPGPGFIAVAPADADDSVWLSSQGTEVDAAGTGTVEVWLPETAGAYELRYGIDLPEGGWGVIGRLAINVLRVEAGLEAPAEVQAGSRVDVAWQGPGNRNDFITIVPKGSPPDSWNAWVSVSDGSPVNIQVPDVAGEYEVRYLTGGENLMLAATSLTVVASEASLSTVEAARAGSTITVAWTGPANRDDFITILPTGTEEGTWNTWVPVYAGEDTELRLPDYEGEYEIRYISGNEYLTLARRAMTVTAASATLEAPAAVQADEEFEVLVNGPHDRDDFITILPVGTDDGNWDAWADASGDTVRINAPSEPGAYEIRYVTGQEYRTLARIPLSVR